MIGIIAAVVLAVAVYLSGHESTPVAGAAGTDGSSTETSGQTSSSDQASESTSAGSDTEKAIVAATMSDEQARSVLRRARGNGKAWLRDVPVGTWVPQVSSKCAALTAADTENDQGLVGRPDGMEESFAGGIGDARILAFHQGLADYLNLGDSELVVTTPADLDLDWNPRELCKRSTMWIALVGNEQYGSRDGALGYCDRSGLPFGECAARKIAPDSDWVLPEGDPADPADPNTYPVLVDTYLTVRDAPYVDARAVGRVYKGKSVTVVCSTEGDGVVDPWGNRITRWDKISRPFVGYVADAYVDSGGSAPPVDSC